MNLKRLVAILVAASLVVGFVAMPVFAQTNPNDEMWKPCPEGTDPGSSICKDTSEATGIVKNLINTFLFAIGILSVIMIVHSGLKYTTSRGDAESVKSAKNTLLYAVVGLIVAMLAFAIVNFVVSALD